MPRPCQQSEDFSCPLEKRNELDLINRALCREVEYPELLLQGLPLRVFCFRAQLCVPASLHSWTQTCLRGLKRLPLLMGPERLVGADEAIGRKILHPRGLACPPNTHVSASMGPPKGKRNSILEVVSGLGALDRVRARLDKNSDPPRPGRSGDGDIHIAV